MYTVTKDTNPQAAKPYLVVGKTGQVVARFAEKRYADKKVRTLNYYRSR